MAKRKKWITTKISKTITSYNSALIAVLSNAYKSGLWTMVSEELEKIKEAMFDRWGGDFGRPTWPPINPSIWGKPRLGSDGKVHGVYTPRTQPLDASGTYERSFKLLRATAQTMAWGSNLRKRVGRGKILLANLMPYAGWSDKPRGDNLKYMPRYVLPDPHSSRFQKLLHDVHIRYLKHIPGNAMIYEFLNRMHGQEVFRRSGNARRG